MTPSTHGFSPHRLTSIGACLLILVMCLTYQGDAKSLCTLRSAEPGQNTSSNELPYASTNEHTSCWNGISFQSKHDATHLDKSFDAETSNKQNIQCDTHFCPSPIWAWWSNLMARCHLELIKQEHVQSYKTLQGALRLERATQHQKDHNVVEHVVDHELVRTSLGLAVWKCSVTPAMFVPHTIVCLHAPGSELDDEDEDGMICTLDCHLSWRGSLFLALGDIFVYALLVSSLIGCFGCSALVIIRYRRNPYNADKRFVDAQSDPEVYYSAMHSSSEMFYRGNRASSLALANAMNVV